MGGRDACDRRGVRVNRVSVVCFPLSLFLSSFSSHYIPVLGVKWSERCLCQGLDIEVFCAVTLSSKKSAKISNRTRFSPCVQISFSTYFRSLFPFTFFFCLFLFKLVSAVLPLSNAVTLHTLQARSGRLPADHLEMGEEEGGGNLWDTLWGGGVVG